MQKIGAQYIAKRIADQLTAPPPAPAEATAAAGDLDGQTVQDETGRPIGSVRRLADLAVYVVADGGGSPEAELRRYLNDPTSRVYFQTAGGRLTGLIYAPDPSRVLPRGEGIRADEV